MFLALIDYLRFGCVGGLLLRCFAWFVVWSYWLVGSVGFACVCCWLVDIYVSVWWLAFTSLVSCLDNYVLDGCCLRLVLVGFVGLRWWLVVVIVLVRVCSSWRSLFGLLL